MIPYNTNKSLEANIIEIFIWSDLAFYSFPYNPKEYEALCEVLWDYHRYLQQGVITYDEKPSRL